jgi:hypothetical protein
MRFVERKTTGANAERVQKQIKAAEKEGEF